MCVCVCVCVGYAATIVCCVCVCVCRYVCIVYHQLWSVHPKVSCVYMSVCLPETMQSIPRVCTCACVYVCVYVCLPEVVHGAHPSCVNLHVFVCVFVCVFVYSTHTKACMPYQKDHFRRERTAIAYQYGAESSHHAGYKSYPAPGCNQVAAWPLSTPGKVRNVNAANGNWHLNSVNQHIYVCISV